ncbi:MAG: hypothetical protein QM535_14815 [Limnohabitans sp.]|nr:hypothetical protein [Limnohabitans sp.]
MKKGIVILVGLISFSCSKKVELKDIDLLNGYWQIEKVKKSDGEKKEYPVNEEYEYFELVNNVGFHKKVNWQPLGKYVVDAMQEKVEAAQNDGEVILKFSSKFGKRTEKVVSLSKEELVLSTADDSEFYYKKVEDKPTTNGQKVE